jgi:hypothetical protein
LELEFAFSVNALRMECVSTKVVNHFQQPMGYYAEKFELIWKWGFLCGMSEFIFQDYGILMPFIVIRPLGMPFACQED